MQLTSNRTMQEHPNRALLTRVRPTRAPRTHVRSTRNNTTTRHAHNPTRRSAKTRRASPRPGPRIPSRAATPARAEATAARARATPHPAQRHAQATAVHTIAAPMKAATEAAATTITHVANALPPGGPEQAPPAKRRHDQKVMRLFFHTTKLLSVVIPSAARDLS